ncbi:ATP-dependent DNA helicase RecG [Salana multivorans]|uniref:ATP-dependent DNA helicase RecG n=1 Tax=Salana multivorans TaxID=120377 RepID=UPI000A55026A|nr:ATP-dependent DNA helicase RecG [Salana multivorans]
MTSSGRGSDGHWPGMPRTPVDRSLRMQLGEAASRKYAKLGLHSVRDLLEHYPRRMIDPGRLTDLSRLRPGQHVVVVVDVLGLTARPMRARRGFVVQVDVSDGDGVLQIVYFAPSAHRVAYLERRLAPGRRIVVDGVVAAHGGRLQLTHPEIDDVDEEETDEEARERASRPKVRYGQTRGLKSLTIQKHVRGVLASLDDELLPDPVPLEVRLERGLLTHAMALRAIHEPQDAQQYRDAVEALRFEEAFVLQAAMARRRHEASLEPATARPVRPGGILDVFDTRLPFTLTAGQLEVGGEISRELAGTTPMHRLLQGEVGSGKTLVALRAMLQVVDNGGQAALLAPTEVLAAQHERSIRGLLGDLGEAGMLGGALDATRVVLLTGSQSTAQRRKALLEAATGTAGIVIGTHALLQQHVTFHDLGLVVVDEQHRFGVEQRDALRAKARTAPHLLVMTATPIPRTVAMTIFGDLEVSTLRQLPAGRADVATHVVDTGNERWVQRMWARVAEEVGQGRRVYVVCPRISATVAEAGEDLDAGPAADDDDGATGGEPSAAPRKLESVEAVIERLGGEPALAGIELRALHGRMGPEEKDAAMADFASGAAPVLVATTVVEVGVDVPEASVMVILDADRFGLSQLHQLRGRIGRGALPGVCFAVTPVPELDPGTGERSAARERLETFAGTRDGFALAEADLGQRREGDVLGAAQHGRTASLRLLRVVHDAETIELAREAARAVVASDPALERHPELAEAITRALDAEREEYLERS